MLLRSAGTTDAAGAPLVSVLSVKQVPALAAILSSPMGRYTHSAQYVLAPRDGLKMVGSNARPNPAQVVKVKPLRNLADQQLVTDAMRPFLASFDLDVAVPVVQFPCRP